MSTGTNLGNQADIEALHSGNQQAFTNVYYHLYERLYWYGRKYVPETDELEDILAESFLQLWKHRTEFSSMDAIAAFLHVAVRNQCYNLIKRRQVQSKHHLQLLQLLDTQEPGDFYIEQLRVELMQKIFAAVDLLPPKMKEIFLLSYQEGLKPAQIAEKLNIHVQTVSNQKVNAIKVLKSALGKDPLLLAMLLLLEIEAGLPM